MKALFKRSDQDGKYSLLATDFSFCNHFLSTWNCRDKKIEMLATHFFHQKEGCNIGKVTTNDHIFLWKWVNENDAENNAWIRLYFTREHYQQIHKICDQIIEHKAPYLMILQSPQDTFDIQPKYYLSQTDLIIIERYNKYHNSLSFMVGGFFLLILIMAWKDRTKD